ncbi:unnamed protein product [Acanthoscelides obtectus]|nr:unnamed protein product [Acanthoscelides obtectus]CAH2020840.1 unnamed protein product [Acanthoscelides obtectus]CAH2020950.1 unnamed protein product [Acanthoscelides obtectus]CAH2021414.1 unnamed protein product [Acanthoscelides obtectus]CAK1682633.1 hypothetical protein AOBTE_LOCUS33746 [Acanthoscelides obtectus]
MSSYRTYKKWRLTLDISQPCSPKDSTFYLQCKCFMI